MRKILFLFLLSFSFLAYGQKPETLAFKLTSPKIINDSKLMVDYTCDGEDVSPELNWSGAPTGTKSFALIMNDPNAPQGVFYHWILYNIPSTATNLPEGSETLPAGTLQGKNSYGLTQYKGACPPIGVTHHYVFTLYALDSLLNLSAGEEGKAVLDAMQNHILEKSELTVTYNR